LGFSWAGATPAAIASGNDTLAISASLRIFLIGVMPFVSVAMMGM
jgi:hypothetical protein